jgi:hypothetical protein
MALFSNGEMKRLDWQYALPRVVAVVLGGVIVASAFRKARAAGRFKGAGAVNGGDLKIGKAVDPLTIGIPSAASPSSQGDPSRPTCRNRLAVRPLKIALGMFGVILIGGFGLGYSTQFFQWGYKQITLYLAPVVYGGLHTDSSTLTTSLAAASALLSAISTVAAWRAANAVRRDLAHTVAAKKHELVRAFEQDYAAQYEKIWASLGPWPDAAPVDPHLRHTVHGLLQTLLSIFVAEQSNLIEEDQAEALYTVMFDWLSTDKAYAVWKAAFRTQVSTWPSGFVSFVDSRLYSRQESQDANR